MAASFLVVGASFPDTDDVAAVAASFLVVEDVQGDVVAAAYAGEGPLEDLQAASFLVLEGHQIAASCEEGASLVDSACILVGAAFQIEVAAYPFPSLVVAVAGFAEVAEQTFLGPASQEEQEEVPAGEERG